MSAICGLLRLDGGEAAAADIDRMLAAMAHRAPDRRRSWARGAAGLGHGLMRVQAEDLLEAQPLEEGGLVLVADLRLDNREALAAALGIAAAALGDLPDSAVLLAAYRRWGADCAAHLIGDFAFALWDVSAGTLLLARDPMGQRGLYWVRGEGFIAFASELRALLALPGIRPALSETFVACWLVAVDDWPVGLTHLEGARALGGGRTLTIGQDGIVDERSYWEPHADPAHLGRDEAYYVAAYRAVLGEAVACRLRRLLRPAALAFSGGYDSAAIAGLAGPVLAERGRKLVAVSAVAPPGAPPPDDQRDWATLCARAMPHLDLRLVEPAGCDLLDGVETAFAASDGPVDPAHYVHKLLFEAAAGAGARVYLEGTGGDYTLNHRGRAALAMLLKRGRLLRFMRELRADKAMTGAPILRTLTREVVLRLLPRFAVRAVRRLRPGFLPERLVSMIAPGFRARMRAAAGLDREIDLLAFRSGMRAECADFCRRIQTYPPPPQAAMAAMRGLEFTRPFHDRRVVELALAIPEALYVSNGRNRHLACRALADLYPSEFQTRGRGQTSGAPGFAAMIETLRPVLLDETARLAAHMAARDYLDSGRIGDAFAQAQDGPRQSRALNALLLGRFVSWFQRSNR